MEPIDDLLRSVEAPQGDQGLGEIGDERERARLDDPIAHEQSIRRVESSDDAFEVSHRERDEPEHPAVLDLGPEVALGGGEGRSRRCVCARLVDATFERRDVRPRVQHLIPDLIEARLRDDVVSLFRVASRAGPIPCGALHLAEDGQGVVAHELETGLHEVKVGLPDRSLRFRDPSFPEHLMATDPLGLRGFSRSEVHGDRDRTVDRRLGVHAEQRFRLGQRRERHTERGLIRSAFRELGCRSSVIRCP